MQAGRLDRRIQLQAPHSIDDGAGNYTSGFQPQFECAANVRHLRGGEDVIAARLQSTSPAIITVRASRNARQITGDWRAVDTRSGAVYAIKEAPRHPVDKSGHEDMAFLEFLAVVGLVT